MIHVGHVHLSTDAPLGDAQAQSLGHAVVGEMNAALQSLRPQAPALHIDELSLHLPGAALADRGLLARCARQAVQRILDRTPE